MSVIDTTMWGTFRTGDLFDIRPTRAYKATNHQLFSDLGDNPVVVNSLLNNGVGGYTERENTEPGQTITFSDTTTSDAIFYQPGPFVGYPHVQGLYAKGVYQDKWNEHSLLFFMTCFRKVAQLRNFSYGDKFTRKLAAEFQVLLPITASGDPDWGYMEQKMRCVIERQKSKLTFLDSLEATSRTNIGVSDWGEFKIGDLFDPIKRATRRTINSYQPGNTPFVTNSAFNNGVSDYLMPKSENDIERGQCISVNTVDGSAFWQGEDFLANSSGNGLLLLRRDGLNYLRALFLCTAIKRSLDPNFTVMLTKGVVEDSRIKLPVTSSGDPDWDYMESTMKVLLDKKTADLDVLQQLLPQSGVQEVV